ncbi:MAG: hypothetical protein LBL74_05770 [Bacteroidales bacterium]|jgi:hypothetical protein|nr:hypothetical protein [Bacteroidales bacterium]
MLNLYFIFPKPHFNNANLRIVRTLFDYIFLKLAFIGVKRRFVKFL